MTLTPKHDAAVRAIVAEMLAQALNGADARIRRAARHTVAAGDDEAPADRAPPAALGTAPRRGQFLDLALTLTADPDHAVVIARELHVFVRQSDELRDRQHRYAAVERAVRFVASCEEADGRAPSSASTIFQVLAAAAAFNAYTRPSAEEIDEQEAQLAGMEGRIGLKATEGAVTRAAARAQLLGLDGHGY